MFGIKYTMRSIFDRYSMLITSTLDKFFLSIIISIFICVIIFKLYAKKINRDNIAVNYGKIVVLEGNISTGKSTLLSNLEKRGDVMAIYEKISHELLNLFYSDPFKYALTTQLTTLCRRNNDIKYLKLQLKNIKDKVAIVDRSLFGDLGFFIAHYYDGRITDKEAKAYAAEFKLDKIDETLKTLGTIIYLFAETDRCKNSVIRRNNVDSKVDVDYLKTLHQLHFHGLLYLKSKGVDVRFVNWQGFGNESNINNALKNENKGSVIFTSNDVPKHYDVIDYQANLVPLHSQSLAKLETRYRMVLNDETQLQIVNSLSTGRTVMFVNKTTDSLFDIFEHLSNIFNQV
jgi:deoxyadenosine/deoxycytidine kinase